ncbi:MAG: RNA polymerase sigma-70 factor [Tannerella sp.]|jgi:RNA polymerase sigma-70 factor (ECF subfamily)|nr:RNA polymerase sigma-70 factor [Tannerella sp.]
MKTDERILNGLRRGEEKAFRLIYKDFGGRVYRFFLSALHDVCTAEDLTQDVFMKLWERHKDIDPEDNFEAYVFTIARHLLYKETDKQLRAAAYSEYIQANAETADSSAEQQIEAESLMAHINDIIEQLPPVCRTVFRLSRVHHLTYNQIAERLKISPKTVETHIHRALQHIKSSRELK